MSDQIERLIAHYQKALLIKPDNAEVYSQLAELYYKRGQLDEAIAIYHCAIDLKPDYYKAYYRLAEILQELQQWHEAIYYYLKVISCYPEGSDVEPIFAESYYKLIEIKNNCRIQEVISSYRKVCQEQPDFFLAYVGLGDLLTQEGNLEEAISCYQTASYKQLLDSHPDFAKNYWNPQNQRQPNFLIIGIGKGGTTSLYYYLVKHPQILPAIKKEIHFFNENIERGLDWYLSHFPSISKESNFLTGEASPWYLGSLGVEKKVAMLFPNVKLIVILRNPVLRSFSQYQMQLKFGVEQRSFAELISSEIESLKNLSSPSEVDSNYWHTEKGYLLFGLYFYFIEKWMAVFPREQFLILRSEDFYANPAATLSEVFEFLGVPDYPLPEYPNYNPGYYNPISDDLRQTLAEFFRPHNQKLEEYLGMKFNWDE